MPITTKQDINSNVFKEFGGNLAYSWSRQNATAGRRDARVYTTETGTLAHLRGLLEPLDESFNDDKCDAGYLCPAMELTTNPAKPETTARRGMYYRCDASVLSSSIVTLDIDDATPADFEADSRLVRRARDAMTLYTTASHTPAAPRYRIVAVVDTPLTGDDIVKARYGLVAMLFEGRKLDRASFTLSQAMYRPYTGSDVIHSKGVRMFDAAELVEFCPEGVRIAQGARETRLSDAERAKMGAYADWMEKACFELDGAFNGPNLILTPTPDHAYDSGYSSDPKLGDFQFCPPREGFSAPNITVLHDSDKAAFEGMTGRQKMEYFIEAVGMDADMSSELFSLLGWASAANDSVCTDADLMDEPTVSKRDAVIYGLMNHKSTFELVGESNIGKSFEMLSRMASVATGTNYASYPVSKRAHCFYFDAEGGEETEIRIKALREQHDNLLEWLHVVDVQKEGLDPTHPADLDRIVNLIARKSAGQPVGIVAFDSLNQTMANYKAGNFDENNSTDMGKVARALKHIADVTGACVGVTHHPAKSKSGASLRTGRGSGALHGAVDMVYYLEDAIEGLNHYVEKNRTGKRAEPFGLKKLVVKVADVVCKETPKGNPVDAAKWGLIEVPAKVSAQDETLFVVPVRLAVYESVAGKAGRKAVKVRYADQINRTLPTSSPLSKTEYALLATLEELQAADDRPLGYSRAEILKNARIGNGGDVYRTLRNLRDVRKYLVKGKNNKGLEEDTYRIATRPNDHQTPDLPQEDYDLNDDLA